MLVGLVVACLCCFGRLAVVLGTEVTDPLTAVERSAPGRLLRLPVVHGLTVRNLTVCLRFWEHRLGRNQLIHVRDSSPSTSQPPAPASFSLVDISTDMSMLNESIHRLGLFDQDDFFATLWLPERWHSFCFGFEHPAARVVLVSNGQVVKNRMDPDLVDMAEVRSEGLVVEVLGQLDGMLADLQIWNSLFNSKII